MMEYMLNGVVTGTCASLAFVCITLCIFGSEFKYPLLLKGLPNGFPYSRGEGDGVGFSSYRDGFLSSYVYGSAALFTESSVLLD